MGRIPARVRKPLLIGLPLVLLVTGIVYVACDDASGGSGHAAANRAQLKRACAGLLPYEELRGLVPDSVAGEVHQYGTMIEPGADSRSLVNCSLTWPGQGSLQVRAAAITSDVPMTVKVDDIKAGEDEEGYEAPGVTGRVGEDGYPWVAADCPGGLEGRVRKVPGMFVAADIDLPGLGKGKRAEYLADFRTAVQVANGITAAQKCGGVPLKMPTRVVDTYKVHTHEDADGSNIKVIGVDEPGLGVQKCRGLGKRAGFPGKWTASGDLMDSRLLSVCTATILDREDPSETDPYPPDGAVLDVTGASWAGPLAEAANDSYDYTGDSVAFRKGERTRVIRDGEPTELALWAESQCAAGHTYHRVTVHIEDADADDSGEMSEAQRNTFSKDARKLMNSYLADPDGWPRQNQCRQTKILGEVEGWQ